jgi:hypothetical protein
MFIGDIYVSREKVGLSLESPSLVLTSLQILESIFVNESDAFFLREHICAGFYSHILGLTFEQKQPSKKDCLLRRLRNITKRL